MNPLKFTLESQKIQIVTISLQSFKSQKFFMEFIIEILSKKNLNQHNILNFYCIAEFIKGNLSWNVNQIVFDLQKFDISRNNEIGIKKEIESKLNFFYQCTLLYYTFNFFFFFQIQ